MNLTRRREQYRAILEGDECFHPASVYDPISARIAEDLGFEVMMFAGSIASATVLGAPDYIVLTLTEFAQQIHRICRAGTLPLMVDADHGYGNALNVQRTVEELETAGVAALTIEDTLLPRQFGQAGQSLIPLEEGIGKMKAALSGRQDPSLVVAGRSSAIAIEGIDEGIRRAKAYQDVGVDAVFMTGISTSRTARSAERGAGYPDPAGWRVGRPDRQTVPGVAGSPDRASGPLAVHGIRQGRVRHTQSSAGWGTDPSDLGDGVASSELMAQVTRLDKYDGWISDFLD